MKFMSKFHPVIILGFILLIGITFSIIQIVRANPGVLDPGHPWSEIGENEGTEALPVNRGGTGLSSIAAGGILYASGANTLSRIAPTAANQVLRSTAADALEIGSLITTDIPNLDAAKITSGTMGTARLGSGTANSSTFLRGDSTWETPAGGGLGYTLSVQALTASPADSVSNYFGQLPKTVQTTANISKVYIRKAGTIKIAQLINYSGTTGTAENWSLYIRKNNTTDYLVATVAVAASERVFTNSALSIAVVAGDYFEMKTVNPAWATNPLTSIWGGYIYIE